MEPFPFIKLKMSSGFFSTGTSFATGLPRLVISTDSRFRLNFRPSLPNNGLLNAPAAIFFMKNIPFDHGHHVIVITLEKTKGLSHRGITKKHHFPKTTAISIASTSIPHRTLSPQTKGFLCKVWLSIRHHEELSSGEWMALLKQLYAIRPAPLASVSTLRASISKPVHLEFLLTVQPAWCC